MSRYGLISVLLIEMVLTGCISSSPMTDSKQSVKEFDAQAMQLTKVSQKTQVIIIGTLHKGHLAQRYYTAEKVRDILILIRPNLILHEVPPKYCFPWGSPFLAPKSWGPDGWACNQAAIKLGIPQKPFDRPDRDEYRKKTGYWEKVYRVNQYVQLWSEKMKITDPGEKAIRDYWETIYVESMGRPTTLIRPEVINSQEHDLLVKLWENMLYDIFPTCVLAKDPTRKQTIEDIRFIKQEWEDRNRIMAQNILKWAQKYPNGRIAVITGNAHRYMLRDFLKNEATIELKEYYEIIGDNASLKRTK